MARRDAVIVLGADVEGLAAAATLAKRGRTVFVVDGCDRTGGLGARLEVGPGHVVPGLANELALVRRDLLGQLELEHAGLRWNQREAPLHVLTGRGPTLAIRADGVEGDDQDRDAFAARRAYLDRIAAFVRGVVDDAPPEVATPRLGDLVALARQGLKLRALGEADMVELLRIVTMPAWDWTEEVYTSDALRAGLIAPALAGTVLGPRASGTTALMLMQAATRGPEPTGGLAALADALRARCDALGVRFLLGAEPLEIVFEGEAVQGVELVGGEHVEGGTVVSALDPARTLLDLVAPGRVPQHVEGELAGWRRRGSSAVWLAGLDTTPEALRDGGPTRFVTAPTPTVLERAADALKYDTLPVEPWLDVRVWRGEPFAPADGVTLCAHVHGVPRTPRDGWTDATRDELKLRVGTALETALPGAGAALRCDLLLTPADLEERFGVSGGHLYQGELALDQLWLGRPSLALARYATPLAGVFLAGAASHPGGPWFGGAGVLGARAALRTRS